jgi:hypothetical protein
MGVRGQLQDKLLVSQAKLTFNFGDPVHPFLDTVYNCILTKRHDQFKVNSTVILCSCTNGTHYHKVLAFYASSLK